MVAHTSLFTKKKFAERIHQGESLLEIIVSSGKYAHNQWLSSSARGFADINLLTLETWYLCGLIFVPHFPVESGVGRNTRCLAGAPMAQSSQPKILDSLQKYVQRVSDERG